MKKQNWQISDEFSLKDIGNRVKKLREEKGWTQEELASMLHFSRSAWKEKEDGRADMKTEIIVRLAQLFNVTTDFLLTGIEAHNAGIAVETGLSNNVINYLRQAKSKADSKNRFVRESDVTLSAVNTLLGSERGRRLVEDIWQYLQADYNPPFTGVTDSAKPVTVVAIAYEAKTIIEGEEHELFIQADKISGALNNAHLGHITSSLKDWKEEYAAADGSEASKHRKEKEGEANAPKE